MALNGPGTHAGPKACTACLLWDLAVCAAQYVQNVRHAAQAVSDRYFVLQQRQFRRQPASAGAEFDVCMDVPFTEIKSNDSYH